MGKLLKQTVNKSKTMIRCDFEGGGQHFYFYCPGCKELNFFNVGVPNMNGADWGFSGDFEHPTFAPSLKYLGGPTGTLCHLFVRGGSIEFLADCPHDFKGKTIPLPQITPEIFETHWWNEFETEWL